MEYNLLSEPWIPCLGPGSALEYLAVRQVLARAPDLVEIVDPSPPITAALHRLLIAVLHRALQGPASEDAWADLRECGQFDQGALDRYFDRFADRFDLFDPKRPFYQIAGLDESYGRSVAGLAHELAAGNNTTLFDHTTEANPPTLTPDRAARLLVALQAYAVGGLVTYDDKAHKSADAAPLAKGATTLLKGRTLFETLVLNMVVYDPAHARPYNSVADRAAWEADESVRPMDRPPLGYADWLTWQSRRIRLFPVSGLDGTPVVPTVAIMKGYQLPDGESRHDYETMMAFTKAQQGPEPWPSVGFREDRALWRDSLPLYGGSLPGSKLVTPSDPPRTLREIAEKLEADERFPLDCYGLVTDKAAVLLWRQERLTVPLIYLREHAQERRLRETLAQALGEAERTARALRGAMEQFAALLLASESDNPQGHQPDPDACRKLADHLGAGRLYWGALEPAFRRLVEQLPADTCERADGQLEFGATSALPTWHNAVRDAARDAIDETTGGLDPSTRVLKAGVGAWRAFNGILKKQQQEGTAA